jgi:uncharacterized protein (TIGR02996 family)
MSNHDALLRTILDSPDDDTARLVLADYLREQPDPADVALGRFLWAGVTAARYRSANVIEADEFYTALAELSAVASEGWPVRWLAALRLGPSPLTERDWGWDNVGDRVTARVGRASGEFARGMLTGLTVSLVEWYVSGPVALAAWPVERVTVSDVPGLSFGIDRPEVSPAGWRLSAAVRVPARRVPLTGGPIAAALSPAAVLDESAGEWSTEEVFPDRAALVAGVTSASAGLVEALKDEAGDRWPRPFPAGARSGP